MPLLKPVALILLLTGALPEGAHAVPPPKELSLAAAALQAQDYAGVIKILEPAMVRLANQAPAWRTLGMAQLRLHHSREAESAFSHALAVDPRNPQPLFYLGIAAAQTGDRPGALAWLRKAAATHRIDMTALSAEADIAAWRDLPDFQALLPALQDFEHPFLEPVHILKEWDGEAAGDQFGWVARVIGDVDHDGINDFVTSAPNTRAGAAL